MLGLPICFRHSPRTASLSISLAAANGVDVVDSDVFSHADLRQIQASVATAVNHRRCAAAAVDNGATDDVCDNDSASACDGKNGTTAVCTPYADNHGGRRVAAAMQKAKEATDSGH